ncbi:MAG: hypothetical protein FJY29_09795 [Betaproteobacteria bacterium]|nr:hypothetical protein [Betaproteobacteria bacterium]
MKHIYLSTLALVVVAGLSACKPEQKQAEQSDSDTQFVPVAVGAAYGVGISAEVAAAAFAAGGIYVLDCTRPVAAGEIRFFCDGPTKLSQAAMTLVVNSTRTIAGALRWSAANVIAHLSELAKFKSVTHLKSAVTGTANAGSVREALVSPEIQSASGKGNFVAAVKGSLSIQDKSKKSCNYVAQYEARLVHREFKGGWMGGTSTRFLARAPSPESAEAMALTACEWFSGTIYKLAPGFAGYSQTKNDCRKPASVANYKEAYRTSDVPCPGVRICTSEANCADYIGK